MLYTLLYSEIHYRFKYFLPLYFKKEPEIIFDLPRVLVNVENNKNLPIYLLVKDAHQYPVKITNICIKIFFQKTTTDFYQSDLYCCSINEFYIFEIPIETRWINNEIKILIFFQVNKKKYQNDNYFGSKKHFFSVYISPQKKRFPPNWFIGDTHYHSNYTSDQVEFGAPLKIAKNCAQVMGLDWFFVTDHSYDLDDRENNYLENDPLLPKWNNMKIECQKLSTKDLQIISGEEVSIGNNRNKNVHLLVINNPNYIQGKGDSAERWGRNKPCQSLNNLSLQGEKGLLIAAHPFDQIPLLQKWLLNRGTWEEFDYLENKIEYLQILNGQIFSQIFPLIFQYIKLLQQGYKLQILAGNDAHGNFQYMKQIHVPFLKLLCLKKQIFGQYFTAFRHHQNDPIQGLKNKITIISNGPFLNYSIVMDHHEFHIGETVIFDYPQCLMKYNYECEQYFGEHIKIILITGNKTKYQRTKLDPNQNTYQCCVKNLSFCFLVLTTEKEYMAMTNPIFLQKK